MYVGYSEAYIAFLGIVTSDIMHSATCFHKFTS